MTVHDQESQAIISCRDTGVGIRPEALEAIFEPFQQESKDIARSAGGLGLGLALVRGLVELHEGTIEARSDGIGHGAEFIVRLPLSCALREAHEEESQPLSLAERILVVEDNEDAAEMLQTLLELRGHEVRVAGNGSAALEALRTCSADVVLCDIGLPGMNGYDLARAIRSDASIQSVALIALTGYGQPEDRRRSLEAGFDEHLTKPVDLSALEAMIPAVRQQRTARLEGPYERPGRASHGS